MVVTHLAGMTDIFENKFSFSYNYEKLIDELQIEIEDECLAPEDVVFILRSKSDLQAEHFGKVFDTHTGLLLTGFTSVKRPMLWSVIFGKKFL